MTHEIVYTHEELSECDQLFKSHAVKKTLDGLENMYAQYIIMSQPEDLTGREDSYRMIRAIKELREKIQKIAERDKTIIRSLRSRAT